MEEWYLLGVFEPSVIFQDLGNTFFCAIFLLHTRHKLKVYSLHGNRDTTWTSCKLLIYIMSLVKFIRTRMSMIFIDRSNICDIHCEIYRNFSQFSRKTQFLKFFGRFAWNSAETVLLDIWLWHEHLQKCPSWTGDLINTFACFNHFMTEAFII